MKITILGSGSAGGVPLIGNNWGDCDPGNPKNRRTRCSALVEEGDIRLLIDTSPDLRQQLLACDLKDLTAVLYTHMHADHTHGIDELRSVNWMTGKPIPIYADPVTMGDIQSRFGYIFKSRQSGNVMKHPYIEPHVIEGPLEFGPVKITYFSQAHGKNHSLGYRFNGLAYTTDVSDLDETALAALKGVKVWVMGCIRERPHPAHASMEKILEWVKIIAPERAYITHMDQSMDYTQLTSRLPKGVKPAHDGLVIEC
jgi:phosphoribosyl 1,2-cyclic phosphate phosphodiesterase